MDSKEKVEIILKEVFGEILYYKIRNFFLEIHNADVDFIIFTTRRSHLLYCMFKRYIFDSKPKCKYIFDDKAIHFYEKRIQNKKGIIADDIMIHGRALENVRIRLNSKNPKKIFFYVYAVGNNPIYSFENMKSIENNLSRHEWEQLSNQIITAIIITAIPYASYVFSYSKKMEPNEYNDLFIELSKFFPMNKKIKLSLEEVDNKSDLGLILNNYLDACLFNTTDYTKENGLIFSCIRVYYNKYLKTCTVLPFSITPAMEERTVCEICDTLFPRKSDIVKTNCIEAKYRAITSYYSLKVFDFIPTLRLIDRSWEINKDDICMSYYDGFYLDLNKSIEKKQIPAPFEDYVFDKDDYRVDSNTKDVYYETFKNLNSIPDESDIFFDTVKNSDLSVMLYRYLTSVNQSEELLLKEENESGSSEKQKGLSLSVINENSVSSLLNSSVSSFDLYSELIQSADTGFLTIFVDSFFTNQKKMFSNFLITGEQVCRLYQNKYIIFVNILKKYFDEYANNNSLEEFYKLLVYCSNINNDYKDNIINAYNHIKKIDFDPFLIESLYKGINDNELENILLMGIGKLKRDERERIIKKDN